MHLQYYVVDIMNYAGHVISVPSMDASINFWNIETYSGLRGSNGLFPVIRTSEIIKQVSREALTTKEKERTDSSENPGERTDSSENQGERTDSSEKIH
jgi:hypothetical protein